MAENASFWDDLMNDLKNPEFAREFFRVQGLMRDADRVAWSKYYAYDDTIVIEVTHDDGE